MYYFQNVIRPFVMQNGTRIEVPVIYGSPEKWASFQKFGYFRDSQGRIMMPIIMFKRDSIEKVRTIGNKLDANQPNLYGAMTKKYSSINAYSNFDILNNRIPVKQHYLTVIPDYVTVTYSCTIMTYYIEQLNKVVEAMNYASDSYWGDPSRFKFKAMIDTFTLATESEINKERIVKATFNIKLNGHLIPDVLQKDVVAAKKVNSKAQIIITAETTSSL